MRLFNWALLLGALILIPTWILVVIQMWREAVLPGDQFVSLVITMVGSIVMIWAIRSFLRKEDC